MTKQSDFNKNPAFPTSQSSLKTPKPKASSKTLSSKNPTEIDSRFDKNNLVSTDTQQPNIEFINTFRKKGPLTRINVKFDVGFNNSIYLRGEGADLSWDRGIMLKNTKPDEWMWETTVPFTKCEFKVLINDRQYELGENHHLQCGSSIEYTPNFHSL